MRTCDELARNVLEVLSPLMRLFRDQVRAVAGSRLTMPQYRLLAEVQRGADRVGVLAQRHAVSQPAMSKIVDGVVRRGLIRKVESPGDRRRAKIVLTSQGEALLREVRRRMQGHLALKLARLSRSDQRELNRSLLKMLDVVQEPAPPTKPVRAQSRARSSHG